MDGKKILKIVAWIVVPTAVMAVGYVGYKLYKKEPIFGKKGDNDKADNDKADNDPKITKDADAAQKAKEVADAKTASGGRGTGIAPDTRHQAVIRRDTVMANQGRR
jgi:hypothetical protein